MASLKQLEATLLGMKQLREYVSRGAGREMLDKLIAEAELKLVEIKRKVIN